MDVAELVYTMLPKLPAEEKYGMRSQMTRAAVSVPCNIAEGWIRGTEKDRTAFLTIAHASLGELTTQLLLCHRLAWITKEDLDPAMKLIDEIARILVTFRRNFKETGKITKT